MNFTSKAGSFHAACFVCFLEILMKRLCIFTSLILVKFVDFIIIL